MATVQQIYTIVNEVANEVMGSGAVSAIDTGSFVALGDRVLSSSSSTDLFTNKLVDRIGKTIFSVRNYLAKNDDIIKDTFEFGCILQKIYVGMPDAKENNAWKIAEEGYKPDYAPVIKTDVKQKLFDSISTWEIDVTIPDYMLRTAFLNETSMAIFIDAIFTSMENRMQLALEGVSDLAICNFIGQKIYTSKQEDSTGVHAINLLKEYNTATGKSLTVSDCLHDVDFLKWSSMHISLWIPRIARMSTLFNTESYQRHTDVSNLNFRVLQEFASACDVYLESNTYHNDLVSLPKYKPVPYWQGSGLTYSFEDSSSIDITIRNAMSSVSVKQSGIIGVMFDSDAVGVTLSEKRSTSQRNEKDEYTNYYNKANMGYFNDLSENGIVFYISEDATTATE